MSKENPVEAYRVLSSGGRIMAQGPQKQMEEVVKNGREGWTCEPTGLDLDTLEPIETPEVALKPKTDI